MAGSESLCQCLVVAHLAAYIYPYRILVKKEYKIFHFYIHPVLLAISSASGQLLILPISMGGSE